MGVSQNPRNPVGFALGFPMVDKISGTFRYPTTRETPYVSIGFPICFIRGFALWDIPKPAKFLSLRASYLGRNMFYLGGGWGEIPQISEFSPPQISGFWLV